MSTRLAVRSSPVAFGLVLAACGAALPPEELRVLSPPLADIVSVKASGEPGAYTFAVGIASPDTGCQQYADWWEVIAETGELLYRRVLTHSHVDEQPFVRPGGPVPIEEDRLVWVRAHMHPGGYGGVAWRGSVATGFVAAELVSEFAAEVAQLEPLPTGCRF